MLYQSVDNLTQNINDIPISLREDVIKLIGQVSRYMLRPLHVAKDRSVYVSACKYDQLTKYIEFFRQYSEISKVYLVGSALTEECRDKSDLDFLVVIRDAVDKDIFIRDTPFEEVGYDDYIVVTESEWDTYCQSPKQASTFYWNVLQKGVVLYESNI